MAGGYGERVNVLSMVTLDEDSNNLLFPSAYDKVRDFLSKDVLYDRNICISEKSSDC